MFNLIVRAVDWNLGSASVSLDRIFEHTDELITNEFRGENGQPLLDKLALFPCLFMEEGRNDEIARVGHIHRPRIAGQDVKFEFSLDNDLPTLKNSMIYDKRTELHMQEFEFSRNHWAVKDADLYRFLFRNFRPHRQHPTVFNIPEHESIDPTLVSVMMPFSAEFDQVYESIKQASEDVELQCTRADDIWDNPTVMQNVISLIDRSRIVVCDCTGLNPNVFYEAGIAHTLGREVILITQREDNIPFDLQHFQYIKYLNNVEGLATLSQKLQGRMSAILGR